MSKYTWVQFDTQNTCQNIPGGSCQQALSPRAGACLDEQGCAHVVVGVSLQVGEGVQGGGAVDGGGGELDRGGGGGRQRELEPAGVLHGRRHLRLKPDCHLRAVG